MAVISKQAFNDGLSAPEITCQTLLHPTRNSCIAAIYDVGLSAVMGSSKFFLLTYALQSLIKWRKLKEKDFLKKQFQAYIRSILYALCYTDSFYFSACLFRKFTNRFYFYSVALSGMCAGLAIFVESNENRTLNTSIFSNLVVETIFRHLYWKKICKRNTFVETLLFMHCSAILLYLLKIRKEKRKDSDLWFYYPPPIKKVSEEGGSQLCNHQYSCRDYALNGFIKYFLLGYIGNALKSVVLRIDSLYRKKMLLKILFRKDKILLGLLSGSYAGIYRIFHCWLVRKYKKEEPIHSAVAGFLAGITYFFKPDLPTLATSITTIIQLLFQRINCKGIFQSNLPTREIIFALCSGFLFHWRFFLSESCPSYIKTMLNSMTNGKANEIYGHVLRLIGEDSIGAIIS